MRQENSNRKICGTYEKLELDVTYTKQTEGAISNRKISRFFQNAKPVFGHRAAPRRSLRRRRVSSLSSILIEFLWEIRN